MTVRCIRVSAQKDPSEARSNNDQQSNPACMFSGCGSVSFSLKSISKRPKRHCTSMFLSRTQLKQTKRTDKTKSFQRVAPSPNMSRRDTRRSWWSLEPGIVDNMSHSIVITLIVAMGWYGKTFNQNLQIISMIKLDPRKSVVCWPCDCDVWIPVGITMLEGTKRGTLGSTWRMLETWCERGNTRHNNRNYPQILAQKLSFHQTVGFGYPPATTGFPNIHESWHMTRLQRRI